MLPQHALELLAPAKNLACGLAAIDHGADAVYIGGPAFGARQAAGNTLEDIAELCAYAHRFDARVFVALNTLFSDDEIEKARELAFDVAKAGADCLIVQDMGLLNGPLPQGIELHASTQCDIRTPEKAAFLEAVGFSQMVLARELSLDEIARVRAALKPETRIECFIHGALCVSYSGQCYMSEAMLGRSANRGACAQLCRLPYDVFTEAGEQIAKKSHVLSLKDNNQTDHLEALIDAGASSFKIEGRLKDVDYVKNITAHYRQALDAIIARRPELSRSSVGRSVFTFTPDPAKSFSRSSTDYFIEGRRFDQPYALAQLDTPKHTGEAVGEVVRIESDRILMRPAKGVTVANADGLTYAHEGDVFGFHVNRAEPASAAAAAGSKTAQKTMKSGKEKFGKPAGKVPGTGQGKGQEKAPGKANAKDQGLTALFTREAPLSLAGLRPGTRLWRNRDQSFLKLLSQKSAERLIPVTMIFSTHEDGLDLMVTDGTHCASASVAMDLDAPSDPVKNRETLRTNLARLGGTIYEAAEVFVPEDLDVFVPASVANQLRRAAVEEFDAMRSASRLRPQRAPVDPAAPYPDKFLDFRANVANASARAFYEAHGARVLAPAFEIKPIKDAALMTCRHCIRAALNRCPKTMRFQPERVEALGRDAFRPEPLMLKDSAGDLFRADFHCKASPCEMTVTLVKRRGAKA